MNITFTFFRILEFFFIIYLKDFIKSFQIFMNMYSKTSLIFKSI